MTANKMAAPVFFSTMPCKIDDIIVIFACMHTYAHACTHMQIAYATKKSICKQFPDTYRNNNTHTHTFMYGVCACKCIQYVHMHAGYKHTKFDGSSRSFAYTTDATSAPYSYCSPHLG